MVGCLIKNDIKIGLGGTFKVFIFKYYLGAKYKVFKYCRMALQNSQF